MSSNLKVNTILPSTGTNVAIGTAGGSVDFAGTLKVGIVTARDGQAASTAVYYGDGSNLTGLTSPAITSIASDGANRVLTSDGDGTATSHSFVTIENNRLSVNRGTGSGAFPLIVRRTDASGIIAEFANSSGYGLLIGQNSATGEAYLRTATGQPLVFTTNSGSGIANERLRIASNGDVGVGKNNPDVTLHVGGGAVTNPQIKLHRTSTYDNAWRFFQSHYDAASYGTLFIQPTLATTPNVEITNSSGAMAMRVDSDTGVISVKSGGGIDFSATGNVSGTQSELLDDYEEGTFTASMQGGSNSGSFSGSQQSRYVKIGKQITCWVMIHGDLSGASGNLEWTGFPFTSENPQEAVGSLQFNNMRGGMPSGTNTVHALMHPSLTKVHFRCNADGNNTAYTALSSSTNYGFTYARLVITYTTV